MPTLGAAERGASGETEQLGFDLAGGPPAPDGDGPGTVPAAAQAAAGQVAMLSRLVPVIRQSLEETGATRLYEEVERPLVRVLAKMEVAGIAVDVDKLRAISDELEL